MRVDAINLVAAIASEATTVEPKHLDGAWPTAFAAAVPRFLALLDDPDPAVRRSVAYLAGVGGLDTTTAVAGLRRRLAVESDRVTRWDLIVSLGAAGADPAALRSLAEADEDQQVRLAAAHGLAEAGAGDPVPDVGSLIGAVSDPDRAGWAESAWFGPSPTAILQATGRLLRTDPAASAAYAIGLSRHADPDQRVAALADAADVLATWRTVTGALVPFLGAQLDADHPEIRFRAAYLLACVDPDAYADRLAELAGDDIERDGRRPTMAGDAAVWALARGRDVRSVPGLRHRLLGDRLGFGTRSEHSGHWRGFWFRLPGIHEVLTALGPVDGLLDAVVTAQHRAVAGPDPSGAGPDPGLGAVLCQPLGAWGPAADAAVPTLRRLVTSAPERWQATAAAVALGQIGSGAAEAAAELQALARAGAAEAAVSLWRVTGAARPAVDLVAIGGGGHASVRWLAEFGPLAAHRLDEVRPLLASDDEWKRIEAAHALTRIGGVPETAIAVLTETARPLADGNLLPVRLAALRYLAEIAGSTHDDQARDIARAVLARAERLRYAGSWRAFDEDEAACAAARTILGHP